MSSANTVSDMLVTVKSREVQRGMLAETQGDTPRSSRIVPGGMLFHAINREVGRQQLFFDGEDFLAFEGVIAETLAKCPLRICADCLMPNHQGRFTFV